MRRFYIYHITYSGFFQYVLYCLLFILRLSALPIPKIGYILLFVPAFPAVCAGFRPKAPPKGQMKGPPFKERPQLVGKVTAGFTI